VKERPYTSASNRAGQISEGRSAAKAKWEADKCSKHFSYRLKGKVGTKRPIPMTSVKSLAARFYRLRSGHAPTGDYLTRFGHRDDDKCWRCGGTVSQTRENLFRHCSRWRDHQKELWKASMIPPVQQWISPDRNRPVQFRSSPRNFSTGIGPIPDTDRLDWAWSGPIPHGVQG